MFNSTTPQTAGAIGAPQISVKDEETSSSYRAPWIHSKAGYHQTDNALRRVAGRKIGAIGYAVYDVICSYADFYGGEACPPIETIADELRLSEPTVIKFISLLVRCKMLRKRTTCWGNAEQGPKSRNFYKPLPSTLWDFSSVADKVKAVRKKVVSDVNEVNPNKNPQSDVNHEKQESSSKGQAALNDLVPSSTDEENELLMDALLRTGLALLYVEQVTTQYPSVCRDALAALAASKTKKENVAGWMRATIEKMIDTPGRTPEGWQPSEADLARQEEKKPPRSRTSATVPPRKKEPSQSAQQRTQSHDEACDRVFDSLEESEQDAILDKVRHAISRASLHNAEAAAARKERLVKQRDIVGREYGLRVEAVLHTARQEST